MTTIHKHAFGACVVGCAILLLATEGRAFRNVEVGAKLPNADLQSLDGKRQAVLDPGAEANVFVFVRAGQASSQAAIAILTKVCGAFPGRRVRCAAVFSDSDNKTEAANMVRAAGWNAAQTLIDKGDQYYGQLGVKLSPCFGISRKALTLVAYEPYAQINFFERIEAQTKYALGAISKTELDGILSPRMLAKSEADNAQGTALIHLNFARRLFGMGKTEPALDQANQALAKDDKLAGAYGLIGLIHAKAGACDKAKPAIHKALALDKGDQDALEARKSCP